MNCGLKKDGNVSLLKPEIRNPQFEIDGFFDNSARSFCTHDVAAAYCLAMADVRVRLPLGAFGVPVVIHIQRVGKLGIPPASGAGDRQFKSDHAD